MTLFDQLETISLLSDRESFGAREAVKRVDTHGAVVFLVGRDAYKIKRAVKFPFMDFSTLEKRRVACEAELAVNRPNAPGVYLGVVPITRANERLTLGGKGEVVEWAVHMRRFDEEQTLDNVVGRQSLTADLVSDLAHAIFRSHQRAPRRDGAAAAQALASYIEQNEAAFAQRADLFDPERAKGLARDARAAYKLVEPLLIARGQSGYVRRCHGDLHLRNIALIEGAPTLFDAVEFDDAIATGDLLYDLAFLLMDLEVRGLRPAANLRLNRYLWLNDEAMIAGLAAMPTFLSLRSAIRAKVIAANLSNLHGQARPRAASEARRYFLFAVDFLQPKAPLLVAIGGLSGTGKSALAGLIAPRLGRAPGAVWLRSDIERKRMFAVSETDHLPPEAYGEATGREVYARLRRQAAAALKAGQSVLVDAVHAKPDERQSIEHLAAEAGVDFAGLWLEAPVKLRVDRVGAREKDASDANQAVAVAQRAQRPETGAWRPLDASGELYRVAREARALLGLPESSQTPA